MSSLVFDRFLSFVFIFACVFPGQRSTEEFAEASEEGQRSSSWIPGRETALAAAWDRKNGVSRCSGERHVAIRARWGEEQTPEVDIRLVAYCCLYSRTWHVFVSLRCMMAGGGKVVAMVTAPCTMELLTNTLGNGNLAEKTGVER